METSLPIYRCRVYINDRLCWNDRCDFAELGNMLTQESGLAYPFTAFCECPECWDLVDPVNFINTGEMLYLQTEFPHQHPMGCGGSVQCIDCENWDWAVCSAMEKRTMKNYSFSAGQFQREVFSLAYNILQVNNLQTMALGGAIPVDEQFRIIEKYSSQWSSEEFDLDIFMSYRYWLDSIHELLNAQLPPLRNHFSFAEHWIKKQTAKTPANGKKVFSEEIFRELRESEIKVEISDSVCCCAAGDPMPEDLHGADPEMFASLYAAMNDNKLVELVYTNAEEVESCRLVLPEILVRESGKWFCAAYCTLRNARRTFRLDRIRSVAVTDQTAESHGIADDVKANGLFGDMDFS